MSKLASGSASASSEGRATKLEATIAVFGHDIVSGRYAGETSLPSEAELCSIYGVSRATLREVAKILASKGLIVIYKHRGLFIQERRDWNYLDTDVLNWVLSGEDSYEMIRTLLETREIIEPEIAGWAAARASADDLAKMEAALTDMDKFYSDKERFNQADIRFHAALIAAAQNYVVEQLGKAITALQIAVFDVTYFPDSNTKKVTIDQHAELLNAIRLRKPALAKKISTQMIEGVRARVAQKYKSQ